MWSVCLYLIWPNCIFQLHTREFHTQPIDDSSIPAHSLCLHHSFTLLTVSSTDAVSSPSIHLFKMTSKHPSFSASTRGPAQEKGKHQSLILELNVDILDWYAQGQKTSAICHALGLKKSTVRTIRDCWENTGNMKAEPSRWMQRMSYIKSSTSEKMEKLLATPK